MLKQNEFMRVKKFVNDVAGQIRATFDTYAKNAQKQLLFINNAMRHIYGHRRRNSRRLRWTPVSKVKLNEGQTYIIRRTWKYTKKEVSTPMIYVWTDKGWCGTGIGNIMCPSSSTCIGVEVFTIKSK